MNQPIPEINKLYIKGKKSYIIGKALVTVDCVLSWENAEKNYSIKEVEIQIKRTLKTSSLSLEDINFMLAELQKVLKNETNTN